MSVSRFNKIAIQATAHMAGDKEAVELSRVHIIMTVYVCKHYEIIVYCVLKHTYITLRKCRLLCEVDYDSMPYFFYLPLLSLLLILRSIGSCYVSCPCVSWSAAGSSACYISFY